MQGLLWTLISIVVYIGGLVIVARMTLMMPSHAFDEGVFMGLAALDILGALLAFGAIVVTYFLFSGNIGVRALDFLLLLGILIVAMRTTLRSFHPRRTAVTFVASRILAGSYCILLIIAALCYIVLLFIAK
ncbi:MAG: hypothetical protein JO202_06800 [Ktedonobacteraceae bacterium]|nr:hypothetical protein [Ktedonobacteraceae bacterium]